MRACVNMGNTLDSPRGQPWGDPLDPAHFPLIRAAGFDTIRLPVRWNDHTSGAPDFALEPGFTETVAEAVDAALAADLNVILNIHHYEAIMVDPDGEMAKFTALWGQIATRFADYPSDLWFEALNEPKEQLTGDALAAMQRAAVDTIRKTNPDRIIILGADDWSSIRTLDSNIPPPDGAIVYTFHYYDPFAFTHQDAPWTGENGPKGERGWGSDEDHERVKIDAATAADFAARMERPVFLGEFGAYEAAPKESRVAFTRAVRQAMEAEDIPWCLWSFTNTFPLYDDETGFDDAMLSALIDD